MKGATFYSKEDYDGFKDFNPRTREGCDYKYKRQGLSLYDFNPRTREGCDDPRDQGPTVKGDISIHAPVKGATE